MLYHINLRAFEAYIVKFFWQLFVDPSETNIEVETCNFLVEVIKPFMCSIKHNLYINVYMYIISTLL